MCEWTCRADVFLCRWWGRYEAKQLSNNLVGRQASWRTGRHRHHITQRVFDGEEETLDDNGNNIGDDNVEMIGDIVAEVDVGMKVNQHTEDGIKKKRTHLEDPEWGHDRTERMRGDAPNDQMMGRVWPDTKMSDFDFNAQHCNLNFNFNLL